MSIKIAVVGCGTWGKNLVRNFYNLGVLDTCCDLDPELLAGVRDAYPEIKTTSDIESIINSKDIDGIAIATPSHTHYPLVKKALLAGKNVYVEKPIATSSEEAKELMELSEENEKVLMVGHLLLYHPAVNRLRGLISEGILGDICYVQSDRLNINFYRNDRSVMWDLAPHDLSMISYVLDMEPLCVKSAVGHSSDNDGIIDITHVDIEFSNKILAHISNSWLHPMKRVVLLVKGSKATAILDDAESKNKLHLYDNHSPEKRTVEYPEYADIEPLKLECNHFISCIQNGIKARSDGANGYTVVRILEEAERKMLGNDFDLINDSKLASSRKKAYQNNLTQK